jgi:hypothetical protein
MRNIFIIILLTASAQVFSQEKNGSNLPSPIESLIALVPDSPKIDTIIISEMNLRISKELFGNSKKAQYFTIFYNVQGFNDSIIWFVQDTTFLVNEYQFLLFKNVKINTKLKIDKPLEKIKHELEYRARQIDSVTFLTNNYGTYVDQFLDFKKLNFDIRLKLFEISDASIPIEIYEYLNIISIKEAETVIKSPDYQKVSLISFKGHKVSPLAIKNENIGEGFADFRLSQFRQCLFDINNLELKSDNVLGKYSTFIID